MAMKISSDEFKYMKEIPIKYTCDGDDVNPPLNIEDVPMLARSLVLIVDDPDAPGGTWNHWAVYNIDPTIKKIEEGSIPKNSNLSINSFGKYEYGGPCPPSGTHRYYFKLYALDKMLHVNAGIKKEHLISIISDHIIESCEHIGTYKRVG